MKTNKPVSIRLEVEDLVFERLLTLLQRGFVFESQVGCTINEFLNTELKLNADYIKNKIGTIFLDGRPVDDISMAVIEDGSTVSLSGAMPGLVGAVMRRGSYYASFRDSISYKNAGRISLQNKGQVRLKFFNIILQDLGPQFLQKGIFLTPSDLTEYVRILTKKSHGGIRKILLNNKVVDYRFLNEIEPMEQNQLVFLTVQRKPF